MSEKLINIVLDLETLSTQEDAAIIQIGCCIPHFDRVHLPPGMEDHFEFEATIKYEECLKSEFHKDGDTMEWWEKQDARTRAYVFSGQDDYVDAFDSLVSWFNAVRSGGAEIAIWGNGSDFDNRLLSYSLDSLGYHKTWNFRNNRDLRTIRAIFPAEVPESTEEVKHTALGDARYEARILNYIVTKHGLGNL